MRQFQCDYIAGCHPAVLQALVNTNMEEVPGYGEDRFCTEAGNLIRRACRCDTASIHFFAGGTQANLTVISSILRPHQGVISATSGHVQAHEAGAIEATGHKILTVPAVDGKVLAQDVETMCRSYWDNDEKILLVQPGMLYISFPTETGTIYTLSELEALRDVCNRYQLGFYIDGARLAYGLAASPDVTLPDLARLADVFYIGGTKCGTLDCEALVIVNPLYQRDFTAMMRLRGALLSKARLGGVQFAALFENGLYEEIGRQAVQDAMAIRKAFLDAGVSMYGSSPTNQQFVLLSDKQLAFLNAKYRSEHCGKTPDGQHIVRFCSAWSTTREALSELLDDIALLKTLGSN
ncbi:MAG: low specificity L-threonine aldolase [Kiritimatiellae bacterium]|nr:low specificity L-threonine aldolase [Kiritimatiellia bacterium]